MEEVLAAFITAYFKSIFIRHLISIVSLRLTLVNLSDPGLSLPVTPEKNVGLCSYGFLKKVTYGS